MKTLDRFLNKIAFKNGCLIWTASTDACGYGLFRVDKKITRAHRFSYETFVNKIPDGILVRHKCDNPSCVLPAHLELGTQQDNMNDKVRRGRHNNGKLKNTHCPQGHPYSGDNLFYENKSRRCRTCVRNKKRTAYYKKKH